MFYLRESCPLALTLMPDNSVLLHMSLMPFKLLLLCWSSDGILVSTLRGTAWDSISLSSTVSNPTGFYIQKLSVIFLALEPWARGPGVGLQPLAPAIFLLIIVTSTCHYVMFVWNRSISHLHPSHQSWCGVFLNSVVIGLPFSLISDVFEWWLFCNLVVLLMWFCEEVSQFTYTSILNLSSDYKS